MKSGNGNGMCRFSGIGSWCGSETSMATVRRIASRRSPSLFAGMLFRTLICNGHRKHVALMAIMDKAPLSSFSISPGRESRPSARAEFVAFPIAILAAFLFRAESFGTSMGPDELSLLVMAKSILDGAFPYEIYWDVRAPLAYFIALPSALFNDAFAALATLRLVTVFVQAGATWTFFCLFRRALGVPATLIGALVLLVSTNMADLHHLAMPNHFVMGMSLAAFACLVAGIRGRRSCFFFSALLAGALPWVMVQSGLVALGLAALVMFADTSLRRTERLTWVSIAVLPSVVIIGAFFLWGPFDTFVRTVFLAPFGVIEAAIENDLWWVTTWKLPGSVPWASGLVVIVGAVWFPWAVRHAPTGSVLRYAGFLVVPAMLGFLAIALIRLLPSPEYFIEAAPAAALFAAIVASRLWHWRLWEMRWISRHVRPAWLRLIAVACLGVFMAVPSDPWAKKAGVQTPLPTAYCDSAVQWVERLSPRQTVLDLSGICGLRILDAGKAVQPPFTYASNWFRRGVPWVGNALADDGARGAVVDPLREALAHGSDTGVVVANGLLLREVEQRGWESFFYDEWRLVWYRYVPGHDAGFDRLAVFVRADMLDEG